MNRWVRSSRHSACSGLMVAIMAAGLLLALGGCGDTTAPNGASGNGPDATPTPSPKATPASVPGWQTYHDAAYNFTVQYPPGWKALVEPQPQNAPYEVVGFFAAGSENNGAAPTQNVITITAEQSEPDTVDNGPPPGFAQDGSITVAGTSQPLLVGPGASGGQGLLVMFAQDNDVFVFYATADAVSAASFRQTFTQMFSTFWLASPSQ